MKNLLSLIMHVVEVLTQQEIAVVPLHLRREHKEMARVIRIQKERSQGARLGSWMLHWTIPPLTSGTAPPVHTLNYSVHCQGGYIPCNLPVSESWQAVIPDGSPH